MSTTAKTTPAKTMPKGTPKGITVLYIHGQPHYSVRCMVHGKRYGLGTFNNLEAAISALVQFKTKQTFKIASESITPEAIALAAQRLNLTQPSDSGQPAGTDNGPHDEQVRLLTEYIDMHGAHVLNAGDKAIKITVDGDTMLIYPAAVKQVYDAYWAQASQQAYEQTNTHLEQ